MSPVRAGDGQMTGEGIAVGCQIGFPWFALMVVGAIVATVVTLIVLYFHLRRPRSRTGVEGWTGREWDATLASYYGFDPSTGALEPYGGRVQP